MKKFTVVVLILAAVGYFACTRFNAAELLNRFLGLFSEDGATPSSDVPEAPQPEPAGGGGPSGAPEEAVDSGVSPEEPVGSGEMLLSMGKYEEALHVLEREFVVLDEEGQPEAARALKNIALCFDRLGDRESALRRWTILRERFSGTPEASLACYELAVEMMEVSSRKAVLEEAFRSAPGSEGACRAAAELADIYADEGRFYDAWVAYDEALKVKWPARREREIRKRAQNIGLGKIVLGQLETPVSQVYVIRPGDSIARIARHFGTTPELILRVNGIPDPRRIRPNQRIKVITKPFSIQVSKSNFSLTLYLGGRFVAEFMAGVGNPETPDTETPVMEAELVTRIREPSWARHSPPLPYGHPDNPLGSRWLGFSEPWRAYGIHGIRDELRATVGQAVSHGCVRMYNEDVELLFDLVPKGTHVAIVE